MVKKGLINLPRNRGACIGLSGRGYGTVRVYNRSDGEESDMNFGL